MDLESTGTPEWWRNRLAEALRDRRQRVGMLEDYYNGQHPLPSPPKRLEASALAEARRAYSHLMRLGVTNWVKLVADAPSERLEVTGFRFSGNPEADDRAWRIWQSNHLDADSLLVHDNALITGQSSVLVDPFMVDGGVPTITCEHSSEMIVAYVPGSRRKVAAALKMWTDGDTEYATLYSPDWIYKWQQGADNSTSWEPRQPEEDSEWPLPNPLGEVPVREFAANQSLRPAKFGGGIGEFETVLPIQDRINKTIFDRLVTAEFQAFRQRWAVGWSPDVDPNTGLPRPDQILKASQSFLWTFEADPSEVKLGEFSSTDFAPFIKATEADVNAMAAISKTPPHYLLGAMVNISGDALTAAESGLSSKTRKHARNFGEVWEDVMRLALRVAGDDELAADMQSEVIWADIEHRTWGEQVDAVLKMQALGIPRRGLWEKLPDVSPQDMARWEAFEEADTLLADLTDQPEPAGDGGQ